MPSPPEYKPISLNERPTSAVARRFMASPTPVTASGGTSATAMATPAIEFAMLLRL